MVAEYDINVLVLSGNELHELLERAVVVGEVASTQEHIGFRKRGIVPPAVERLEAFLVGIVVLDRVDCVLILEIDVNVGKD
jgi:hypothetical protein